MQEPSFAVKQVPGPSNQPCRTAWFQDDVTNNGELQEVDGEGKKRRLQVLEEEQREREERVRTQAKKFKNDAEQVRQDKQADQ